ncbi:hypothetical protein [Planctomicrobium sp. SH664]|uniref:hypothetical protein n=1 Tax=Planctomicrobium sp. SH664 TaxID=3448125 RepID=UPI003F5C29AE
MIIPTPEFDPLFADDGTPFHEKMREYIRREFQDLVDLEKRLLDELPEEEAPNCIELPGITPRENAA